MDHEVALYAQVAILAQLGRAGGLFTYGVPDEFRSQIHLGSLVNVPFTSRQLQGVVCALDDVTDLPRVRDIVEVLDPFPAVTPYQLQLARWLAKYYAAPLSDIVGAMLPPGLGRKTVYVLQPGPESPNGALSSEQAIVLGRVRGAERITLEDLEQEFVNVDVQRIVGALLRRGLLTRRSELTPPRVKPRSRRIASATSVGLHAVETGEGLDRAPRRRAVLQQVALHGPLPVSTLSELIPGASVHVKKLVEEGMIALQEQEESRSPIGDGRFPVTRPLDLSIAQRQAYSAIVSSLQRARGGVFLLHGVTGSGKTEVYLQVAAETIRLGRQVIMMVPEISLTPQAVERVAGRFPGRVAVLHSKLSAGERVDEWQRIRRGEVDIVVGPRSALFAPLPCPGLIVVDEEHDPSYKQDSSPRYNARDAAAVLGRLTGGCVIFGSATPDVGTYHAACSGRITLLDLPHRPVWGDEGSNGSSGKSRSMPPVEIVDLRQELKSGNRGIFSEALLEAMNHTLEAGQQALLFLNRRGSATVVLCRDCGYVVSCANCDIPFTYHATAARLICHRCDQRTVSPRTCPGCDSPRIRYLGIGTQRVEEEVKRLFPRARVLRWDRDVTGGKEAHDKILHSFARHEADILVGTQMIAKGLDFPLVTLVGVISADTGLHLPDFRSPERSFQLLTQVAGRAGRASLPSRVVVQTYTPDHYAIQAAKDHDYLRFYQEEMSFRQIAQYPPFARLMRFVYSAEDAEQCRQSAQELSTVLDAAIVQENLVGAETIGPAPCFIARARGRYYWQIIVRGPINKGSPRLHSLLDYIPAGWTVDVDPVDLL